MTSFDANTSKRNALLARGIIKALEQRNFQAFYCTTSQEAADLALSLIPDGSIVSWGGSETVRQTGLIGMVKEKGFPVIDRDTAENPQERTEMMRRALLCDVFLTSVNAISEDGILVNVDSGGNRVAAIAFGPGTVIIIAGMNKVCRTVEDAETRARRFAAPINAIRLGLKNTPCTLTGSCTDCKTDECICSMIMKTRMNKTPGRIKIILVDENLGF